MHLNKCAHSQQFPKAQSLFGWNDAKQHAMVTDQEFMKLYFMYLYHNCKLM